MSTFNNKRLDWEINKQDMKRNYRKKSLFSPFVYNFSVSFSSLYYLHMCIKR